MSSTASTAASRITTGSGVITIQIAISFTINQPNEVPSSVRGGVEGGFGFYTSLAASISGSRAIAESGQSKGSNMSFGLYAIGFAVLTIGLIYGAYLVHVPRQWIVVGAIVLIGVGILSGVKATRQRDTAA